MMKKFKYTLLLMLFSFFGFSQQLPHYSLYMFNDAIINPAICGTKDYNRIDLVSRSQWSGFEGAPMTQLLSYQRSQGENMGIGGSIFNDETGPSKRTGVQLSYAYNFLVSDDYTMSFGISGSIYQYVFDYNKTQLHDNIFDPAAPGGSESVYVQDATFGAFLTNNKYYLGISVPQLIQSKIQLNNSSEDILERHYFLTTGYTMVLNPSFNLEPSLMLKSTDASPLQYDVNLRALYENLLWFGLSYRDQDALVFMAGVNYDNYSFGYSYDKILSDIAGYSDGSHGLFVSYKFNVDKDSDKDGVIDKYDACPNEFGSKDNNGCPDNDTDGDGVIDRLDKCPNEFGSKENNGCPDIDTDGDGIIDRLDNCPKTSGDKTNNGCPILSNLQEAIIDTAFNNLEFVFSKAEITFDSYSSIERLGKMLANNPSMRLEIEGHTDNFGSDYKNKLLSEARANAVKEFLISRGTNKDRIITSFYGEDRPIAPNDTEEGRAKNRRVELKIYFD